MRTGPIGDRNAQIAGWLNGAAAVGLVSLAALRCVAAFRPRLYWEADPRVGGAALTEFGPAATAFTDWLSIVVLGLAAGGALLSGRRVWTGLIGLWIVGAAFAVYHGAGDYESLRIGGHWLGALALGLAAMHLAQEPAWRRFILAAAVAMLIPIGLQVVYQVTVEHAGTVQEYERQREQIAQQRGWEPGSVEQRKFEERLYQIEALGRFAFSNVLGTVAVALSLLGLGAGAGLVAGDPRRKMGYAVVGVGLVGPLLLLLPMVVEYARAGAPGRLPRGAVGTFVIAGVAVVVLGLVSWWWMRRRREGGGEEAGEGRGRALRVCWRAVALGVVALGVAAVLVRGAAGEPETAAGERSLLFRYHYWQAAAGMVAEQPIAGVGPGRFQDAYLLHKNPLNPENVADPHNVFVSYVSTLGVGGLAWSVLLLGWLWQAAGDGLRGVHPGGRPEAERVDQEGAVSARGRWWLMVIAGLLAFGTQHLVEMERYWIDNALLWLIGAVGFVGVAGWLAGRRELDGRAARVGLFAAAVAVLLHSQIEMSLTDIMGAPLLLAVLGLAAGAGAGGPSGVDVGVEAAESRRGKRAGASGVGRGVSGSLRKGIGALSVIGVVILGSAGLHLAPVLVHESRLAESVRLVQQRRLTEAAEVLAAARSGYAPQADVASIEARVREEMALSAHHRGDRRSRDAHLAAAVAALDDGRGTGGRLAHLWRSETALSERAAELTGDGQWAERAVAAAGRTLDHDPYGLSAHVFAADLAWDAGNREAARRWYGRALEIHDLLYLDPNHQLAAAEEQRVRERLAAGSG